jgi:hypothetical protein
MPAITALHTLGFLANVVAIPFFIAQVGVTCALVVAPTARKFALCALLTAATSSLYTEFAPLLAVVSLATAVFAAALGARPAWRGPLVVAGVFVAALAIHPRSDGASQLGAVRRAVLNTAQTSPFQWFPVEQLPGAAWLSDSWSGEEPADRRAAVKVLGGMLCALAAFGMWRLVRTRVAERSPGDPAAVTSVVTACLLVGPLLVLIEGRFPYQGRKLFFSFAPLMALGVAFALSPRAPASCGWPWRAVASALSPIHTPELVGGRRIALLALTGVCAFVTWDLLYHLSLDVDAYLSTHRYVHESNLTRIKNALRAVPQDDVVLALGPGQVFNTELSFAARRHRVWLASPELNSKVALGCTTHPTLRPQPRGAHLVALDEVPHEATVYLRAGPKAPLRIEGDKKLVQELGPYQVWRVGPGPYALVPTEFAERPAELDRPSGATAKRK